MIYFGCLLYSYISINPIKPRVPGIPGMNRLRKIWQFSISNWWWEDNSKNTSNKTDPVEEEGELLPHLTADGAQHVIDQLDDFDILLFSGKGYWFSYLIETLTWSEFSHIGIVLKDPTYLSPELTGVYLLESGSEKIIDAEDHKVKWGVQITDLKEILEGYVGQIYYRKLNCPDIRKTVKSNQARLRAVHDIIHNKPYDAFLRDLARTELDLDIGDCHRTDRFVCSALVAYIYAELGLLPVNTEWDLQRPKDFAPGGRMEKELLRGAKFEKLVRVL